MMELLQLPLVRMASLRLVSGIIYETFSPPLHFVQQREVALSTIHPNEGAILHDGPHLRLIQLHEAFRVE